MPLNYINNIQKWLFIATLPKGLQAKQPLKLYSQIKEGMDDIASGNTRPFSEATADIRSKRRR